MDMVRARRDPQGVFQVRAGLGNVARVEKSYAIVVTVLGRTQVDRGLLKPAVAHGDMQLGALRHIAFGACGGYDKLLASFLQFARMKQSHAGFEGAELRRAVWLWLARGRRFGGSCGLGCL